VSAIAPLNEAGKVTITTLLTAKTQSVVQGAWLINDKISATIINAKMYVKRTLFMKVFVCSSAACL